MGSLVALSLTVEEKEECVLSSNRKDNAAFAVSEAHKDFRANGHSVHTATAKVSSFTFRLASVFQQVFVWNSEVAPLEAPPLPVWPFCGVQLPGRWVG